MTYEIHCILPKNNLLFSHYYITLFKVLKILNPLNALIIIKLIKFKILFKILILSYDN